MHSAKWKVAAIACSVLAAIGLLLLPYHRERVRIRERIEQMRRALRSNDGSSAAALVIPIRRTDFDGQKGLGWGRNWVGADNSTPWIWVAADTASVSLHRQWHYGIIPGGHMLDMAKIDGEWYFTGVVHID